LRVGTIPCLGASERTHHGDVAAGSQLGQRGAEINPLPGVYSIRQVFGGQLIGSARDNAIIFAMLIIVLVFRPVGLLGMRVPDRA